MILNLYYINTYFLNRLYYTYNDLYNWNNLLYKIIITLNLNYKWLLLISQ